MPINTTVDPSHHNQFWWFVNERQHIFYKRFILKKPRPWTKDKTLQTYFFTNVYRQLDRGTLYLTTNIYPHIDKNSSDRPDADALFNTLIYRLFNHIPTWERLLEWNGGKFFTLGTWNWKPIAGNLKKWRKEGNQVFTSAFTVTGQRFGGFPDKIDNICWLIGDLQAKLLKEKHDAPLWERIMDKPSMEKAWVRVRDLP